MSKVPVAGPRTEGRILGLDWTIANVASLLRSHAGMGAWRSSDRIGGSQAAVNQGYMRKVSAKHLPTGVSVIFMRLAQPECWYASLCFSGDDNYLPWNDATSELWLCALFGEDRARVIVEDPQHPSVRQFTLKPE